MPFYAQRKPNVYVALGLCMSEGCDYFCFIFIRLLLM